MLKLSETLRSMRGRDGALVLDLKRGEILHFNTVASLIYERLQLGQDESQIIDGVVQEFRVSREIAKTDIEAFLESLQRQGLASNDPTADRANTQLERNLAPYSSRDVPKPERHPKQSAQMHLLVWKAFYRLLIFDFLRLGHSFAEMHLFIRHRKVSPRTPPVNAAEKVCEAVNRACVWYPKLVLCLQRSVVTTCLLRDSGVPAEMVMGARGFPFGAHAWTEVHGHPVNEQRDVQQIYGVWERC